MGALRLLAESYTPDELNGKAWALYTQFRPEVNEWGKRSEVSCSKILALRKQQVESLECRPTKAKEPMLTTGGGLEESRLARRQDYLKELNKKLNENLLWIQMQCNNISLITGYMRKSQATGLISVVYKPCLLSR
jgi:hypothetical protein